MLHNVDDAVEDLIQLLAAAAPDEMALDKAPGLGHGRRVAGVLGQALADQRGELRASDATCNGG